MKYLILPTEYYVIFKEFTISIKPIVTHIICYKHNDMCTNNVVKFSFRHLFSFKVIVRLIAIFTLNTCPGIGIGVIIRLRFCMLLQISVTIKSIHLKLHACLWSYYCRSVTKIHNSSIDFGRNISLLGLKKFLG